MIILRGDQQECVNHVRLSFRHVNNVCLQAPTGAGKTVMATHMLTNARNKGNRGFFICHRRELIDQTRS